MAAMQATGGGTWCRWHVGVHAAHARTFDHRFDIDGIHCAAVSNDACARAAHRDVHRLRRGDAQSIMGLGRAAARAPPAHAQNGAHEVGAASARADLGGIAHSLLCYDFI